MFWFSLRLCAVLCVSALGSSRRSVVPQDDRKGLALTQGDSKGRYRLYVNAVADIDHGCSPAHVRVEPARASMTSVDASGS